MTLPKVPASFKPAVPFLKRAAELDRAPGDREKLVAFYLRNHAMAVCMDLRSSDASSPQEEDVFLMALMELLENEKKKTNIALTREEAARVCEDFALAVFKKADDVDRAGKATKQTAKAYYASASFFEMLKQFDPKKELEPDVAETMLYAKLKATDILKALREGRTPTPGDPVTPVANEEETFVVLEKKPVSGSAAKKVDVVHEAIGMLRKGMPDKASELLLSIASFDVPRFTPKTALEKTSRADAIEYCKFAASAFRGGDDELGNKRLQNALKLLAVV